MFWFRRGCIHWKEVVYKVKLKMDSTCSNNQAEQLAIIKVLEAVGSIHTADINTHTATIFTDSKITLDSLQNASNDA